MVAESDFHYEDDSGGNEANGPADPNDPRFRFRAYPTRIEMPQLSSISSLLLLFPKRIYENQVSRQICDNVDLGMDLVGRSLSQEETDAFVSQAELLVRGPRQGAMIGLVAANLLSFAPLRRALIKPHTIDMAKLSLRQFPYAKLGVTSGFGIFTGAVFGNVWAAANASRNLLSDDRLKQFRYDRKYQDPDVILKRVRDRAMTKKGYAPGAMANGGVTTAHGQNQNGSGPQSGYYNTSTAGPYAVSQNEVSPTVVDDGTGGSKIISDINTKRQRDEYNTQARPYYNQSNSNQEYSGQQYAGQQEQDFPATNVDGGMDFFDADSDSSADPDSPRYKQPPGSDGQQGGSAWDRVRNAAQRENGVSVPAQRNRQQQINATAQGSEFKGYMGSAGRTSGGFDENGAYSSKDAAQKEFNELVERERALGSGADSTASGPKW
ncbi:glycine decarboxylase subunit P [Ascosphaera pollenicola]|nr:glycine decarboxylase subunit P [Ascosphaera pollenicola]